MIRTKCGICGKVILVNEYRDFYFCSECEENIPNYWKNPAGIDNT